MTLPTGEVITTALVPPFAYVGRGGRSRYITPIDWNAWEPRLGFAWVPGFGWNRSEKMVVRGGYGLSHATLTGRAATRRRTSRRARPAYGFNTRVVDPNFVARICCNKPLWIEKSVDETLNIPEDGLLYLNGINVAAAAVSDNVHTPASHSWSTTVGYQLPWQTLVEVTYNGSRGIASVPAADQHQRRAVRAQRGLPGARHQPARQRRRSARPARRQRQRHQLLAGLPRRAVSRHEGLNVMLDSRATSQYHGITLSVRRRSGRGFSYTANYTYGKSMDNASDSGGVRFTDFNPVRTNGHIAFGAPLSSDWSVSTFDIKHAFARRSSTTCRSAAAARSSPTAAGWSKG